MVVFLFKGLRSLVGLARQCMKRFSVGHASDSQALCALSGLILPIHQPGKATIVMSIIVDAIRWSGVDTSARKHFYSNQAFMAPYRLLTVTV